MSAIDRAFIRAYEPESVVEVAPAGEASPEPPTKRIPLGVNTGSATHWAELDSHSRSFYVFAHSSQTTAPPPQATVENKPPIETTPAASKNGVGAKSASPKPEPEPEPLPHSVAVSRSVAALAPIVRLPGGARPEPLATDAPAETAGQRRPLSEFLPPDPVDAEFRPAYEVDRFAWPSVAEQLADAEPTILDGALETLLAVRAEGRTLVGFAGADTECGCSTTLACLAMQLSRLGLQVAMVDGNFCRPGLAKHLRIAAEIGWEDVLAGRTSLAEAVVHSVADQAVLLPLTHGGTPAAEKLDGMQASVTAGVLRCRYDLTRFDLGSLADATQNDAARRIARNCRLDAAVLMLREWDAEWTAPQRLRQVNPELADVCIGVVQRASHPRNQSYGT